MVDTGVNKYLNRLKLTEEFSKLLYGLFKECGLVTIPFGHEELLKSEPKMLSLITKERYKKSEAALMVKFSPDLICFKNQPTESRLFYADIKTSITPVFFKKQLRVIERSAKKLGLDLPKLHHSDIGEIEREAWMVYTKYYPKKTVAVVMATPYNQNLALAEWVSELKPLYVFKKDRNEESAGSGTPHVNLYFPHMRKLDRFLRDEFDINVKPEYYSGVLDQIKTWNLNKPAGRVNWTQFNNVVNELRVEGCSWLKNRRAAPVVDPEQKTFE